MASSGEAAVRRMTALEVCRAVALEVWRAERPHEPFFVHGLNSERAVRERLQKLAMELDSAPHVPDMLALQVLAVNWRDDDPLTILEKTEHMIAVQRPGSYAECDELLGEGDAVTAILVRMLVVQSVAGRMGRWSVRSVEIPDARTARTLYKDLGDAHWSQYRALISASETLAQKGRHRDSAISLLDADRLVRTPAGLLNAAASLTKAGDYISALWAARACLLEPKSTFESPEAHGRARGIEGRLRAIIEGRAALPLADEEAQLLVGDTEVPPERIVVTAHPPPPSRTRIDRASPPPRDTERVSVKPIHISNVEPDEALFTPVPDARLPSADETARALDPAEEQTAVPKRSAPEKPERPEQNAILVPAPTRRYRALPRRSQRTPTLNQETVLATEEVEPSQETEQLQHASLPLHGTEQWSEVQTPKPQLLTVKHIVHTIAKRAIVERNATLPPHPVHRELLKAEQDEALAVTEDRGEPSSTEHIGVDASGQENAAALLVGADVLQLVSETFELDINLNATNDGDELVDEGDWQPIELESLEHAAMDPTADDVNLPPMFYGDVQSVQIGAQLEVELTETPTDCSVPMSIDGAPEAVTHMLGAANVITQRIIRVRSPQ